MPNGAYQSMHFYFPLTSAEHGKLLSLGDKKKRTIKTIREILTMLLVFLPEDLKQLRKKMDEELLSGLLPVGQGLQLVINGAQRIAAALSEQDRSEVVVGNATLLVQETGNLAEILVGMDASSAVETSVSITVRGTPAVCKEFVASLRAGVCTLAKEKANSTYQGPLVAMSDGLYIQNGNGETTLLFAQGLNPAEMALITE